MKPICVPCQRFFRPKTNGTAFVEGMPTHNAQPGTAEADLWKPYKLWLGDLWECHGCGANIIVGVGMNRIAEHYEPNFDEQVAAYKATIRVNDC